MEDLPRGNPQQLTGVGIQPTETVAPGRADRHRSGCSPLRISMHGLLFCQLERFVVARHGRPTWTVLLGRAGLPGQRYRPDAVYDDGEMHQLVNAAAALLDQPAEDIQEAFGVFLAPQLLQLHTDLIQPQWRTLDLLLHTETLIHGAVRQRDPRAEPPRLEILQTGPQRLQLNYRSPRNLSATARGIIHGLAAHYGDGVQITERLDADQHHQMIIDIQPAAAA